MIPGFDCSYDELTDDEATRLYAAGMRVFVQCLWTGAEQPPPRVINLRVAQQHGFILIGYISLTPARTGKAHVAMGRSGVPDDLWADLVKVPIDVELAGLNIGHVNDAMQGIDALQKPRDIYTSYNQWVNVMGNPTFPDNTGGWDANWDGDASLTFPRQYGGLDASRVWGKQYRGAAYIQGQLADADVFSEAALGLTPQPLSDIAQTKALIRQLAAIEPRL